MQWNKYHSETRHILLNKFTDLIKLEKQTKKQKVGSYVKICKIPFVDHFICIFCTSEIHMHFNCLTFCKVILYNDFYFIF